MFVRNKYSTDYTDTVKAVYNILSEKYKYTIRSTLIFELLKDAFGLKEFDLLDPRLCNNGLLESYLIDKQLDWQNGKEVNFSEISEVILKEGEFSGSEKLLFKTGNIEERLWAIFLAICSPEVNL